MESGNRKMSKSQSVKFSILLALLLLVLVFNGKIKQRISAWRMRSMGETERAGESALKDIGLSLSGISQILGEKFILPSSEKGLKEIQGWPDHLVRDIFSFGTMQDQTPDEKTRRATGAATDVSRKGEHGEQPAKVASSRFKLEATLTGGAPIAVINNQPLAIGQSISGYQLREIKDKEAILTRDGEDVVLKISPEE
ncbi:MAG: hypothetical protein AB1847_02730 [bacterium]